MIFVVSRCGYSRCLQKKSKIEKQNWKMFLEIKKKRIRKIQIKCSKWQERGGGRIIIIVDWTLLSGCCPMMIVTTPHLFASFSFFLHCPLLSRYHLHTYRVFIYDLTCHFVYGVVVIESEIFLFFFWMFQMNDSSSIDSYSTTTSQWLNGSEVLVVVVVMLLYIDRWAL